MSDAFEAGREPGCFVWISMQTPTPEEFAAVTAELNLHPLAVEDAHHAHQRPKLETYGDTLFIVTKTVDYDEDSEVISTAEVHVFAGDGFVVSIHHDAYGLAQRLTNRLEHINRVAPFGNGGIIQAIIDHAVDTYEVVVDEIEADIDELESQVFAAGRTNPAERIFKLKRQVLSFQRSVVPLLDALDRLVRQQVPISCRHPELPEYFRDIQDHTLRVISRIETARDTLGAALDANLAQVGVRQNEDMRAISGWAAVIAVPTLLAGVWGMNFEHMPELGWQIGYPLALMSIFASGAAVRWKLRKNGWL